MAECPRWPEDETKDAKGMQKITAVSNRKAMHYELIHSEGTPTVVGEFSDLTIAATCCNRINADFGCIAFYVRKKR